jgi:hypothetical protein
MLQTWFYGGFGFSSSNFFVIEFKFDSSFCIEILGLPNLLVFLFIYFLLFCCRVKALLFGYMHQAKIYPVCNSILYITLPLRANISTFPRPRLVTEYFLVSINRGRP